MSGSFYLGALRAAEEMASHLGDIEKAQEYRAVYESGRSRVDAALFNGDYYIQDVRLAALEGAPFKPSHPMQTYDPSAPPGAELLDPENPNYPKLQIGHGCLSDQLIGQWYARMLRLGDLFDPEHVQAAIGSVFRYNWRSDLSSHPGFGRNYALNDEAGLLVASWPHGGRPGLPTYFGDEVWCGMEYQVASHLIYEGFLEEGLAVVKGVRDRHAGVRRNPWNEFECVNHYARSMASYALLLALSDFFYSAPSQALHFAPRVYQDDFRCFFSVDSGWGVVKQTLGANAKRAVVEIHAGALTLRQLSIGFDAPDPRVMLAGSRIEVSARVSEGTTVLRFAEPAIIPAGESLVVDA
jgi:hypothetical protein